MMRTMTRMMNSHLSSYEDGSPHDCKADEEDNA